MSAKKKKGVFIVFEGPDRSGKTTQIKLLEKWLKEKKVKFLSTREPGGTRLAEKIRKILLDPGNEIFPMAELFLYESARAQHVAEKIMPALDRGLAVISDRFYLATTVYQGYGRGLPLKTVETLNRIAAGKARPDLTFIFLMPEREFGKRAEKNPRIKTDRMEKENKSFRVKINAAYRKLSKRKNCVGIDATKSVREIHEKIVGEILKRLKNEKL